ncbi:MAG: C45 family autoproteolytic acyltransferase/hydrolase, partial [Candidatus Latescibacteria bacterium]|nr:C45 family autoproteolytic acyltransferase/hydrolase [Candidatus Latescibacterota bacterium]
MKQARRFPVVEMQGSPFEMGRQYGIRCRDRIHGLAGIFDGVFLRHEKYRDGAHHAMAEAVPVVREAAPELLEEVEGIAAGAEIGFDDAFRLSCSAEMGQWQGCQESRSAVSITDECTSFAARTPGGTLVAWNMDWYQVLLPYIVLLSGKPDDGPAFLAFALAGSVGRPGMSEQIAISANQLPYRPTEAPTESGPEWAGPGVPYCFLSRMLLQQATTRDAVALFGSTRRMVCLNYTLGDTTGDICCVETTPAAFSELPVEDSFVTHANSYYSPEFHGMQVAEREEKDPRAATARRMLLERADRLCLDAIFAAQTCHFPGQDTGVCHH